MAKHTQSGRHDGPSRRPPAEETRERSAPPRRHAGSSARTDDQDYMKRGKSGRRNFGFLVVLAVHWLIIGGLLYGMKVFEPIPDRPPLVVEDVPPTDTSVPPPEPIPPEIETKPVEIWIPVPENVPQAPSEGGATAPRGSTTPAPAGPDAPVRLDPRFPPTKPDYPASSKRLGHEGVVTLLLLVGPDGRVIDAKIERGSGYPELDDAALRQARTWRFKPAEKDGKPVSAWYRTSVRFELSQQ